MFSLVILLKILRFEFKSDTCVARPGKSAGAASSQLKDSGCVSVMGSLLPPGGQRAENSDWCLTVGYRWFCLRWPQEAHTFPLHEGETVFSGGVLDFYNQKELEDEE